MAEATLEIHRLDNGRADRARAYRIVLDGERAGSIRAGETVTIQTTPGSHSLRFGVDWARSRQTTVELAEGTTRAVRCYANATPWTILFWITLGSQNYIAVDMA